jgi:hypothetical protein
MKASARMFSCVALALTGVLASGCSTNARRVDCDWRLEPINQPAPKRSEPAAKTASEAGRADR